MRHDRKFRTWHRSAGLPRTASAGAIVLALTACPLSAAPRADAPPTQDGFEAAGGTRSLLEPKANTPTQKVTAAEYQRLIADQSTTEGQDTSLQPQKSNPAKTKPISKREREAQAARNAEQRKLISRQDLLTQSTFWASEYEKNPQDREAALALVDVLRRSASAERAVQVADEALANFGEDRGLSLARAKALPLAERPFEAVQALRILREKYSADWEIESALGIALDATGLQAEAIEAHKRSLALKPGDADLQSNLGFSYLLAGDVKNAEIELRAAHQQRPTDIRIAQNLVLTIGVQGRFDEAEAVARQALPPEMIANNIAYLRALLTEQRRWGKVATSTNAASALGTATRKQ